MENLFSIWSLFLSYEVIYNKNIMISKKEFVSVHERAGKCNIACVYILIVFTEKRLNLGGYLYTGYLWYLKHSEHLAI